MLATDILYPTAILFSDIPPATLNEILAVDQDPQELATIDACIDWETSEHIIAL